MKRLSPRPSSARRQRGVVLFVAIIVLLAMTLAGLALLRQMRGGTAIAGNIAFKESATSVADLAVENARAWLTANLSTLANDSFAQGYASSWGGSVDPTTFTWDAAHSVTLAGDSVDTGNTTQMIIQRLCAVPNLPSNDPAQNCSDSAAPNQGQSLGGASYGSPSSPAQAAPFYRVTSKVTGVRNTVSYTQVILQ